MADQTKKSVRRPLSVPVNQPKPIDSPTPVDTGIGK